MEPLTSASLKERAEEGRSMMRVVEGVRYLWSTDLEGGGEGVGWVISSKGGWKWVSRAGKEERRRKTYPKPASNRSPTKHPPS